MNNVTSLPEHRAKLEKKARDQEGLEPTFGGSLTPYGKEGDLYLYDLYFLTPYPESQIVMLMTDEDAQIAETDVDTEAYEDRGVIVFTLKTRGYVLSHEFVFVPSARAIVCHACFHFPTQERDREQVLNFAWCSYESFR